MFREFYKTYNLMEIDAQTSKNKYKYKKEDTNMKVLVKLEHTLNEVTDIVHKTLDDVNILNNFIDTPKRGNIG